jgi:putative hydrolase of the HAD superfamily
MTVRAVVFDIGGVLEITPRLGMGAKWEETLGLQPGELSSRAPSVWKGGSLGTVSEAEVRQSIGEIFGLAGPVVDAFMGDLWKEYLGTLNAELADYFRCLRPRYQTAMLSNSFVGARSREQELYHFNEMADFIIYSHEVGMAKPERRIYELTCDRLDVQPEEMVFLDDSELCVDGARDLGIQAILFSDNGQAIADIEACLQA